MAHKGKFKPPVEPLRTAFSRAIEAIDSCDACAVFMVGGMIHTSPKKSKHYEKRVETLAGNLVGIYDDGADIRQLRADIEVFYGEKS